MSWRSDWARGWSGLDRMCVSRVVVAETKIWRTTLNHLCQSFALERSSFQGGQAKLTIYKRNLLAA